MDLITLIFLAVALSADAFAASLSQGVKLKHLHIGNVIIIAAAFGVSQAVMPLIGWAIGSQLAAYIDMFDHWIIFGLLVALGLKSIWSAYHSSNLTDGAAIDEDSCADPHSLICSQKFDNRSLALLAFATSLDALAVGVGFAVVDVPIILAVVVIGVTTFLLSLVGVFIGHRFGLRFRKLAEILGGVILILIGTLILLEHLGIL